MGMMQEAATGQVGLSWSLPPCSYLSRLLKMPLPLGYKSGVFSFVTPCNFLGHMPHDAFTLGGDFRRGL